MQRSMMLVCAAALASVPSSAAFADHNGLRADPFVFVGTAPGCAPTPPGSNIVTSAWLRGMGLPDNLGPNTQAVAPNHPGSPVNHPATTGAARDPHTGLLLNKNGPTSDCSSAGAEIKGFPSGGRLNQLGFDIRNGTHCGAAHRDSNHFDCRRYLLCRLCARARRSRSARPCGMDAGDDYRRTGPGGTGWRRSRIRIWSDWHAGEEHLHPL